ncbi:RABL3 [Acanthosepion pharaonis]|uniref:RABL3 n=1 Tax=Acanthosepion pharaonis TaxID=158019 RepID=A0A812BWR8_ACAPH|nr:RABL3 [Sepia pharaonis]
MYKKLTVNNSLSFFLFFSLSFFSFFLSFSLSFFFSLFLFLSLSFSLSFFFSLFLFLSLSFSLSFFFSLFLFLLFCTKLHEYKAGTASERTYFVELWEVGGTNIHANSRYIFYNTVHGIILVHDLTNKKSHQNLRKWLCEALNKGCSKDTPENDFSSEMFAGWQIPILVIGTKVDLAKSLRDNILCRKSTVAEECGAAEMNIDCKQKKYLAPGSTNAVIMSKFFDKVIERRFYSKDYSGQIHLTSIFDTERELPEMSRVQPFPVQM